MHNVEFAIVDSVAESHWSCPNIARLATMFLHVNSLCMDLSFDEAVDLDTLRCMVFSMSGIDPDDDMLLTADGIGIVDNDEVALNRPPTVRLVVARLSDYPEPIRAVLAGGDKAPIDWSSSCTRSTFPFDAVSQPACVVTSTSDAVCSACAMSCQPPGTTRLVPGHSAFVCACARLHSLASSGASTCLFAPAIGSETPDDDAAHAELVASLAATSDRLYALAAFRRAADGGSPEMANRLRGMAVHVQSYRSSTAIRAALARVPLGMLHATTEKASDHGGCLAWRDALLVQLTRWFKRDFFKWVNKAPCSSCSSDDTELRGGDGPRSPAEVVGGAGSVEVYGCRSCGAITRFPRFNNPVTLLDWKQGRCGEWANCFTLIALAAGFDARHVTDFTDHVWTEVWSDAQARWLHVDACEAAVDAPLLYEGGWGKKLNFCFSAGLDEFVDSTRRYTKHWDDVLLRRRERFGAGNEAWLADVVAALDAVQRMGGDVERAASTSPTRLLTLRHRRAIELRALEANIAFDDGYRHDAESTGRISGSLAWRAQRGELGALLAPTASGASAGPEHAWGSGWQLCGDASWGVRPEASSSAAVVPAPVSLSSFGGSGVLLAIAADRRSLLWRGPVIAATTGSPAPPTARTTSVEWKTVRVVSTTETTGEPPGASIIPWPPANARIAAACGAEPTRDDAGVARFFALLTEDGATVDGGRTSIVLWGGDAAGPLPVVSAATMTPGARRRPWRAVPLATVLALPKDCSVDSMVFVDGRLLVLMNDGNLAELVVPEGLLVLPPPTASSQQGRETSVASSASAYPSLQWHVLHPLDGNRRITALTVVASKLLLAYRPPVSTGGDARSREGDVVVVVSRAAVAASDAVAGYERIPVHMIGPTSSTAKASGDRANRCCVVIRTPTVCSPPLDARRPIDCYLRLTTEDSGAHIDRAPTAFDLATAAESHEWLCLARVGLPSESAVAAATNPCTAIDIVEHRAMLERLPEAAEQADAFAHGIIPWPQCAVPTDAGVYTLRRHAAEPVGSQPIAISAGAVIVVPGSGGFFGPCAESEWAAVPLCPASDVAALAGGAGGYRVVAATTHGALWSLDFSATGIDSLAWRWERGC